MEAFFDIAFDVLIDAVKDTLYLIPFLFVTYVLMEWIEHRASEKMQRAIRSEGFVAPAIGGIVGAVPQCGFSAAASTLYAARVITIGTLIAVYLSTSDEMLPIFIAEQVPAQTIAAILLAKIVIGVAAGVAIDGILRITHHRREEMRIHELCERANCHCEDCLDGECEDEEDDLATRAAAYADRAQRRGALGADAAPAEIAASVTSGSASLVDSGVVGAAGAAGDAIDREIVSVDQDNGDESNDHHGERARGRIMPLLRSAARHTAQVTVFVFVVVLALNGLFAAVGEETLATFISLYPNRSVPVAALIGLIPNCAASVTIAQLYVDGFINSGAMMAGLLSAAGVGLLVLFRTNTSMKRNFAILGMMWVIAVVCGLFINALGIVF